MSWPLSQDYNEAIQSPASNFADPDLQRGEAVANALGLPMPYSGNFADVYQVRGRDGSRWAVKCFTREVHGLRERYQKISAHLGRAKLPFMVDFSYLDQGIRVGGQWFPVLKMQWVEGLTLNQFVGQYLDRPARLEALAQMWARMGKYLRAADVAHCDLQHGNVLLVPGADSHSLKLKLIDYDGMWVPDLAGTNSGEVGHPSYQHPRRLREQSYNIEVDRFPLLLIATALQALKARGKELWDKYDNGDNLLFKEPDLREPLKSRLFLDLTKTDDAAVKPLVDHLIKALRGGLETTPLLEELMPDAKGVSTLTPPTRPSKLGGGPPSGAGLNKSGPQAATAAPATTSPRPSRLVMTADATAATAAPTAPPGLDFDGPAPEPGVPKRRRKTKSAGTKGMRIGAIVAAAVIVFGLLGGVAVWSMSGPKQQQTSTSSDVPPPPKPPEHDAILVLEIDQPGAEVSVDGQKQAVDVPGDDKPVTIRMKPGPHEIAVSKDGFKTIAQELRLAAGQRPPLSVRLVAAEPPIPTPTTGRPVAQPPVAHTIVSRLSGKVMSVRDNRKEDGSPVVQWEYGNSPAQQWNMIADDDDWFYIVNADSGGYLSVQNGGSGLVIGKKKEGAAATGQQWKPVPVLVGSRDGEWVKIINRATGKALDLARGDPRNGAVLVLWVDQGSANQIWKFGPTDIAKAPVVRPPDTTPTTDVTPPAPTPVPDDPIQAKLDKAKADFDAAVEKYQQKVHVGLDKVEESATKAANKDLVAQVQAEREAFDGSGDLPKSLPSAAEFKRDEDESRSILDSAYAAAIKAYTNEKKEAKADAVKEERKEFQQGHPTDAFRAGSVWKGNAVQVWIGHPDRPVTDCSLTVLERNDKSFKAVVVERGNALEAHGTIERGVIRWLAKDVKVIRGGPEHDSVGKLKGNLVELQSEWMDGYRGKPNATVLTVQLRLQKK